ncbi:beta-1,3-galactosyltransferase 5 [Condylostylus longicornis]|uniref:beta-1,3-galactosyltransferase 5 n=1 Tax=Condylostylus longicornis TaxID=2530218 RepID=UPI00244DF263|nr:beta-1,3-galactosyltransferase 5 [Condylostylus longicornis]
MKVGNINSEYQDKYITVRLIQDVTDDDLNSANIEPSHLVNLKNFKYIINNNICTQMNGELLGIILVTSYIGHDQLRAAHRQAISQDQLKEFGFLRVFLLAEIPKNEKFISQEQVIDEQLRFNDLIQGNFNEAYRNLTYKHLMGLKWVLERCNNAKFIIKVDDDIVFDIYYINKFLRYFHPVDKYYIAGYVLSNQKTIRNQGSKWYVSKEEYFYNFYPDYLSGWLYITNQQTCKKLVLKSQNENFFWIDDIFVTGILRNKLNIALIKFNDWYSANSQFLECCLKDSINFFYECEYFVGPNGGDTKLIINFLQQIKKCYLKLKLCKTRPENKSLKKTCVAEAKNLLERDHGEPFIRSLRL